jgi:hypothetical protein
VRYIRQWAIRLGITLDPERGAEHSFAAIVLVSWFLWSVEGLALPEPALALSPV